jgi:hypothetical protein
MILVLKIALLVAITQGCATIKEPLQFKIIIVPPTPKTFFEKKFPQVDPEIPSNMRRLQTPWRKPPLQVT